MATLNPSATTDGTWLSRWEPENTSFWSAGASGLAWRTLTITTLNLTMAFIVWFLVSALVVRLPQIGFKFTPQQLFWLAAMPGLAGGTLRLVHMFLTPMFGTRLVVSLSTLSLLIPLVGWFYAVQNPTLDPVADDVGSLGLDILMRETGLRRGGFDPYLVGY